MKRRRFFACILAIAWIAAGCSPKLGSCTDVGRSRSGWKVVWIENFDGPAIDTTVWTRVGTGKSDWNDMMSLREDLAYIENGELVLLGKVNDGTSADTTAFVTAGLNSRGKKSFRMAKVEIRAKFNSVNGFWPALWLMPDARVLPPDYAEIDMMEHLNADSLYTLHIDRKDRHSAKAKVDPDGWNIYGVEMYPDSLCLFTNGVKSFTYPRVEGKEYQFPWTEYPFFLILSNQLGGKWVGPVNRPEQLPSELRVDWIKVYQRKER